MENEKAIIDRINILREEIEDLERKAQKTERESDFETVAKIRYGELQKTTRTKRLWAWAQSVPWRFSFYCQQVTANDIADVVSKWTGIPVSKLQQSEKTNCSI